MDKKKKENLDPNLVRFTDVSNFEIVDNSEERAKAMELFGLSEGEEDHE